MAGVHGAKSASKSKTKKSPTRIQKVFRRVQSKPDSLELLGTSPTSGGGGGVSGGGGSAGGGAFFGRPLDKICPADRIPQPIVEMLVELRIKGKSID